MVAEMTHTRRRVLGVAGVAIATGALGLAGAAALRSSTTSPGERQMPENPSVATPSGLVGFLPLARCTICPATGADPPVEGHLPSFAGATSWLNTDPLTPEGLRGKVVLVDFWTYTCVNWLRTLPYVRAWAAKYADAGLTVDRRPHAGVRLRAQRRQHRRPGSRHERRPTRSPSTATTASGTPSTTTTGRRSTSPIRRAGFAITTSARANTRCRRWSSSSFWSEAGAKDVDMDLVSVDPVGLEVAADYRTLRSPETYLGYGQAAGMASPDGLQADESHDYTRPERLGLNEWAPEGSWSISRRAATATAPNARLLYRFQARDVNLVMGPAERGTAIPFRVYLDGQPATDAHGTDVAADGTGTVAEQRTYQLIRQSGPIDERVFEIEFLAPGVELFCFTFG